MTFSCRQQPLDLCSPDRTLLMAEEMVLHQVDLLPEKVRVGESEMAPEKPLT